MDWKTIGFVIMLALVVYELAAPYNIGKEKSEITVFLSSSSQSILEGASINVKARAVGKEIEQIELSIGEEVKIKNCGMQSECVFEETFSPKKGVYALKTKAISKNAIAEDSTRIVVSQQKKTCINGIAWNSCAEKKPFYCSEGVVEEKCSVCGCEENQVCIEEKCVVQPTNLSGVLSDYPNIVLENQEFSIIVSFENAGLLPSSAYRTTLATGENVLSKEFLGKENEIVFEGISLPEGPHSIGLKVFGGEKEIYSFLEEDAILSIKEVSAIEAPSITTIFSEGDDAIISWSKVTGAKEYNLYKSISANAAFISYKKYLVVSGKQTSEAVQALGEGTHFFVITASDYYGNESDYSNVESITIGGGS